MIPRTYYLAWPDRVITLLVVTADKHGFAEVTTVGRKDRFKEALGGGPFPSSEKALRLLAMKVGATVKASL